MRSPFFIEGPATISFSGGRTSAYMLRRVLDEGLQPDVHVLFANTGKERNETLTFVHEVEQRWAVRVRWLEYRAIANPKGFEHTFEEVDFAGASRNGEPFEQLLGVRRYLPNPVTRLCTQELKIRIMQKWTAQVAGFDAWDNVVGLRADEPRRVAKMKAKEEGKERYEVVLPLADAGTTKADVMSFWAQQSFDLQLRDWEGNCDLCFLKGRAKKERIIRDFPEKADWWGRQEERFVDQQGRPATFRIDQPSYRKMAEKVRRQPLLPMFEDPVCEVEDDLGDCVCHD